MSDRTYGFSRSDAESLTNLIGVDETESIVRPVVSGQAFALVRFQLNEDLTTTTADADIIDVDGNTIEEDATIEDPESIFTGLQEDGRGIAIRFLGRYFIVNAKCPPEPE